MSRRLKAARWLAGDVDEKGRPQPMSAEELAQLEPLRTNGITANAIGEIERMVKTHIRPADLLTICEALGLPAEWFSESDYRQLLVRDPSEVAARLATIESALKRVLEVVPIPEPPVGLLPPHGAAEPTQRESQPPGTAERGSQRGSGQS